MNDFVMTQLCADAMGITLQFIGPPEFQWEKPHYCIPFPGEGPNQRYDPFNDDAQAMALVKKFHICCNHDNGRGWEAQWFGSYDGKVPAKTHYVEHPDLGRAIVECVAQMQLERTKSAQSSGLNEGNPLSKVG